ELVALLGLATPDQPLALQVAEVRGGRPAGAEAVGGEEDIVGDRPGQGTQHRFQRAEQGVLTVASLLTVEDGEDVLSGGPGDTVAGEPLQEAHQQVAVRLVLKELAQELLEARTGGLEPRPGRGSQGADVVGGLTGAAGATMQVEHATGGGQGPLV